MTVPLPGEGGGDGGHTGSGAPPPTMPARKPSLQPLLFLSRREKESLV